MSPFFFLLSVFLSECTSSIPSFKLAQKWPWGCPYAVEVDESNFLYLGAGGGIYILDVAYPNSVKEVTKVPTEGVVLDLKIHKDILWVANGPKGVVVLDIKEKKNPTLITYYSTPSAVISLYLSPPFLYVGCNNGEVLKWEVSSPYEVKEVKTYNTKGEKLRDVIEHNEYLIIAYLQEGVKIFNQKKEKIVAQIERKGYPHTVKVVEHLLYVAERTYGIRVFDISSITKPKEIMNWKSPSNSEWDKGWTLECDFNYVWVADGNAGVRCLKQIKRKKLKEVWKQKLKGSSRGVMVKKNKLYTTQVQGMLTILSPHTGTLIGSFFTPDNARGIFYRNNFIYIADGASGVYVLEWKPPSSLLEVAHYKGEGCFWDVKVDRNYIYTTNGKGVMVLKFDPIKETIFPLQYYKLPFPGTTHGLYLWGKFLFVACGKGGAIVLNKLTLAQVKHIKTKGYCWDIYFSPPYLFLSCNDKGVEIFEFNISQRDIKKIKNYCPSYEKPKVRVSHLKGSFLYVGGRYGVHILKVPHFKEIRKWESPGEVCDIYVDKNNYIYVACGNAGIYLLDNKNLTVISSYPSLFWCYSLHYSHPYLYTTDEEVGIMVLRVR